MNIINGHVINLSNSIIGVSILAMPYCFKQCGIILSILMFLMSSIISRLACHFLLKSAIISRRKTFEFLAFHIFGSLGKLAVEIGIIGFLLGTCIAFFVVMGDLAPEIVSEVTGAAVTNTMRTSILMALALFCVLPLGLLRNVGSLNGVSQATICFYCCLVLKTVFEATPHLFTGDWYQNVNLWKSEGILQCLPIFSMSLFCQTQLFEIYQAVPNATLDKMNNLVHVAVSICTCVYILVGTFGYIAFANKPFTGNILLSFSPSFVTGIMKVGFVLSVAFSFPLVIFPCRASLHSLLYKEGYSSLHEGVSNYIPEGKFKGLTMFIVFISLVIGIMIPNIELVLGLVGSTIGVMICVLFPVTCFICISPKNTNERILAQLMLMIGIFVMVLGTYKNLHSLDNMESSVVTITSLKIPEMPDLKSINKLPLTSKADVKLVETVKVTEKIKEVRHEPPQPLEPVINESKEKAIAKEKVVPEVVVSPQPVKILPEKTLNESKVEEVDIEAIKKEDKEVEMQEKEKAKPDDHQILIDTIQKQHEVQKEMIEQQKKLIEVIQNQQKKNEREEKLKAVKEIEDIARKAIEKISEGKDDEKVVKDVEKDIKKVEQVEAKSLDNIALDEVARKALERINEGNEKNEVMKENEKDIKIVQVETMSDNDPNTKNQVSSEVIAKSDISSRKVVKNNDLAKNEKPEDVKIISPTVPKVKELPLDLSNAEVQRVADHSREKIEDNDFKKDSPVPNKVEKKNVNVDKKLNNSGLFLKMGNSDVRITDERDPQRLLPLPIAMNNQKILEKQNLSSQKDDKEEANAMRREILSIES